MNPLIGNQRAKKLDTPELMEYAYKSYCSHLAKGKSKISWNLKTPVKLTWQTMETYIKENPTVFNAIDKEIALSDGFAVWEQVIEDSAKGNNKNANAATLHLVMRNKYGWDRKERDKDENESAALQANEILMQQITQLQIKEEKEAPSNE